jgi:hypothetical protein
VTLVVDLGVLPRAGGSPASTDWRPLRHDRYVMTAEFDSGCRTPGEFDRQRRNRVLGVTVVVDFGVVGAWV